MNHDLTVKMKNALDVLDRLLCKKTGYRRYALAACLGMLLTLSLPPLYILPAACLALTAILRMHDACLTKRNAFLLGWWFGLGHFVTGLYWISFALLVDGSAFWWLIPFAVFGIPSVLALYIGLTFLALHHFSSTGLKKLYLFATIWTLVEMLRGVLFTGFPWNLIGSIWNATLPMLQLASIVGIWGLSFLTILILAAPYTLWHQHRARWRPCLVSILLLMLVWIGGNWRLAHAPSEMVPDIRLRIVQGNIPQTLKWEEDKKSDHLNSYIQLSLKPGYEHITHLIWPETAMPYTVWDNAPWGMAVLKDIVPPNGALITGVLHGVLNFNGSSDPTIGTIWNDAMVLSSSGKPQFYHKSHLVPFGEYIPFRNILGSTISKITEGSVDFTSGTGPKTLSLSGFVPFSPLICYEAIFPDNVIDKNTPPQLLVNLTNDGWYGYSSGPFQHFESARLRAIEQGMPLIRAANTGISGVVDPYGRVITHSELQTTTVLDSELPRALSTPTLYSKIGRTGIVIPLMFFLLFSLFQNRRRHDTIKPI